MNSTCAPATRSLSAALDPARRVPGGGRTASEPVQAAPMLHPAMIAAGHKYVLKHDQRHALPGTASQSAAMTRLRQFLIAVALLIVVTLAGLSTWLVLAPPALLRVGAGY